jgi:hypothetical protein
MQESKEQSKKIPCTWTPQTLKKPSKQQPSLNTSVSDKTSDKINCRWSPQTLKDPRKKQTKISSTPTPILTKTNYDFSPITLMNPFDRKNPLNPINVYDSDNPLSITNQLFNPLSALLSYPYRNNRDENN